MPVLVWVRVKMNGLGCHTRIRGVIHTLTHSPSSRMACLADCSASSFRVRTGRLTAPPAVAPAVAPALVGLLLLLLLLLLLPCPLERDTRG